MECRYACFGEVENDQVITLVHAPPSQLTNFSFPRLSRIDFPDGAQLRVEPNSRSTALRCA